MYLVHSKLTETASLFGQITFSLSFCFLGKSELELEQADPTTGFDSLQSWLLCQLA